MGTEKINKILVVDDEETIRELLAVAIESRIKAKIIEAVSGNSAIEKIKANRDITLIICDYNMPDGNGGMVYRYLIDNNIDIPYVLSSIEDPSVHLKVFSDGKLFGNILKPDINQGVSKILSKLEKEVTERISDFVPVGSTLFKEIKNYPTDIHVKLSTSKYVKVFKKGEVFEAEDFERYRKRGVKFLFIKPEESDVFIRAIQDSLKKVVSLKGKSAVKKINSIFEIVHSAIVSYGFTDEVKEMASESISETVTFIKKEPGLKNIFKDLLNDEGSYITQHSTLIPLIACMLATKFDFKSESTGFKLSLASFMHDITLKSDELARIQSLEELEAREDEFTKEDIAIFKRHPVEAANMLRGMTNIPPDVDRIVIDHHEMPDGSGFPKKINHTRISLLSSIFIISHRFADELYSRRDKINVARFVDSALKHYSKGRFSEVLQKLKSMSFFR